MAIRCLNETTGIGARCKKKNSFSPMSVMFLTIPEFEFDTAADFANETEWLEAIRDGKIYPIQGVQEVENQNVEPGIYTSNIGRKTLQYQGIRGAAVKLLVDFKTHRILKGYAGQNWRLFKADTNNNIKGTSPDGTKIRGFALDYFEVLDQPDPTGADAPAFTVIEYQEADNNEWDIEGVYLENPTFLVSGLNGVGTVVLTQTVNIAANAFTCTVKYVDDVRLNGASSGADTESVISGLVAANFQIVDAGDGSVRTPSNVTESTATPGTYTVTVSDVVATDTVQVIPSTAALWESAIETLA